ncbi:MAG: hypothetical protein ACLQNE_09725 [Thermoguttaceae bacterium]
MARKKASKQEESSDSQQAGQGPASTSAENPQSGRGKQGKRLRTTTRADVAAAFNRLRERANRGNRAAQDTLIQYVNASPALKDSLGDMAQCAETALIETITKGDWLAARLLKQGAAELRQQVSRPSQSPLEDLAVQRLVACWVQLQFVESMCGMALGKEVDAKFWLQRQQQVHKLYAAAEKSLLLVRGVLPASVQVATMTNVAVSANIVGTSNAQPDEKASVPEETQSFAVAEGPSANFNGANRIAGLMDTLDQASDSKSADAGEGLRRVNGSNGARPNPCAT